FAPGPLDAAAARAAIVRELAADFTPEQIASLQPQLNVIADKYSEAELNAAWEQIKLIVTGSGFDMTSMFGCFDAEAWRITVTRGLVPELTPEIKAETEALFAQFGDKVVIRYVPHTTAAIPVGDPGLAPAPGTVVAGPPFVDRRALRMRDFVSRPGTGRCLRGALAVKAKRGVKSVRLTAGKRHATAAAGERARLALKQRSTRVTVTVTLQDGRSASQKLVYRRCA
ncbi:MAG TPA: hypothetical protein VI300_20430, partial [Solirubrobacter sp.]